MEIKDTFMSRLHHMRRILPSPTTASRISDVKELPLRTAASRKHEVDRQVAEIERLVKLAEQFDPERRRQSAVKSSTTTRPMPEQTGINMSSQRQHPAMNVHQDVILVPVARTTAAALTTATVSDSRCRRLRGTTLPLSQLLDVKSLERCPKCHKVRLDVSSSGQDVAAAPQSRNSRSGGYSRRLVRLKALVDDSHTATTNRNSQSRKTPVKTAGLSKAKTPLSTTPTFNQSRYSTINTTVNRHKDQGQSRGHHVPACIGAIVVSSDRECQHDTNNNYDCESGNTDGRSTWPRKVDDYKLSNGHSSTSPGDKGKRDSRPRPPVWRKRSSLSAVQQAWAEQSTQRTTTGADEVKQNVDNSPPSAASSYDPLDTVDNTDDQLPAQMPVNGHSAVLTRVTNVGPPVASSITEKLHQTTSSTALQQPQQPTSSTVTGKRPDNVRISARRNASTNVTTDDRSAMTAPSSGGVPAELVISIPVINWASRTTNPRRRTVCFAPSVQQFQSPPADSTAVSRDHQRRSKSPWSDQDAPCDRPRQVYNYGRSWYDGLDHLD